MTHKWPIDDPLITIIIIPMMTIKNVFNFCFIYIFSKFGFQLFVFDILFSIFRFSILRFRRNSQISFPHIFAYVFLFLHFFQIFSSSKVVTLKFIFSHSINILFLSFCVLRLKQNMHKCYI